MQTTKLRLSLASVCHVHWDVSIHMMNNARISTFDFSSTDFHLLSGAKTDFRNFQGSPDVSSVAIKSCNEEDRISSKTRLAQNPCVANIYINIAENKITCKVSYTSSIIKTNKIMPPLGHSRP